MSTLTLFELPGVFRGKAQQVRADAAAEQAATAWERAAELLEGALRGHGDEPLDLTQAELESGYSRFHLRRLLREGTVPNSGRRGEPRILRRHLPRKPGHEVASAPLEVASSEVQLARAVANGGR